CHRNLSCLGHVRRYQADIPRIKLRPNQGVNHAHIRQEQHHNEDSLRQAEEHSYSFPVTNIESGHTVSEECSRRRCHRMIRYRSAISSESVIRLDHAAPRNANERISHKLMSTLNTATKICADDLSHW